MWPCSSPGLRPTRTPRWRCPLESPAEAPQHVELKVSHCEPGVRGDTATNVTKPATLETGLTINVPLFIGPGDTVKVDTRSGQYLERA